MPNDETTRDLAVLQLLTRLIRETDRIVRLADDIDNYAETEEAKEIFSIIGTEVNNILKTMETNISPLYAVYDIDNGLKSIHSLDKEKSKPIHSNKIVTAEIVSRQEQ